jgi:hypothetical protein
MKKNDFDYELIPAEKDEDLSKEDDYELIPVEEETTETDYELIPVDEEISSTVTASPAFTPPEKGFTYEQFKNSPELKQAAIRFAKDRLGYDNLPDEDAIDEAIEHFRKFEVNELVAGGDWNYTSALATDNKRQQINDYKSLYRATKAMENFGGGVFSTVADYAEGAFFAPSTALGLILPGGGKLAGIAATQTAKLGIGKAIGALASRPITTLVATETGAGVLQDISAQQSLMAVDEQDDYSFGQTLTVGALSGASTALVSSLPVYLAKKYGTTKLTKFTKSDDLLVTSQKVVEEKNKKANELATKTLAKAGKAGKEVKERLKKLNEEAVASGKKVGKDVGEQVGIDEPLRIAVTPDKFDRVNAAAVEVLGETGLLTFKTVDKGREIVKKERITEAISRVINEAQNKKVEKALADDFGEVLVKYNLTVDDFSNLYMSEFSEAARLLQKAGHNKKQLKELMSSMENVANSNIFSMSDDFLSVLEKSKKAMDKNDVQGFLKIFNHNWADYFRSADALRLAAMTSQVATTVRNTAGGYIRVGFDVLTQALDNSIQAIVSRGKGTQTFKDAMKDTFAIAYGLADKNKALAVEQIFAMGFQNKAQRLFRQLADLEDLTGVGLKGNKKPPSKMRNITTGIGRNLNVLNTLSDNMFKRTAFMGSLERQLRKIKRVKIAEGKTVKDSDFELIDIMREGRFNEVFGTKGGKKALDTAIEEALYFTYQASPKSDLGQLLVKGANNLPFLTTSLVPFPRFLANAMRFTYEYSPLYLANAKVRSELARSFGKEVTEEFGVRTYTETAKGLTGLGFLMGATAFRMSDNSGEKWYEGKSNDGKTYDMRPFFPLAPFLFFGDLVKRAMSDEEVIDKRTWRDSLQAVTGMQVGKAGFGMYAMDKFVDDIGRVFDGSVEAEQALAKVGVEFSSNIISTYFMPFTPFQDAYNTFIADDDARIIRENNIEDLGTLMIRKSLSRVPGNFFIEELLNDAFGTEFDIPKTYESPTRTGLLRRQTPISRQLTGRLFQERKTDLEKELDRLRIGRSDVLRRTGVADADRLLGFYMGEFMEDIVAPFIKTDLYKKMPYKVKKEMLLEEIRRVRKEVKDMAIKTKVLNSKDKNINPYLQSKFKRLPKIYRNMAYNAYHDNFGDPGNLNDYDYEILFNLASDLRKTKLRNMKFEFEDIEDELEERDPD